MINLPKNLQEAVDKLPYIIGVSPNAFSRVVPASFLEKYSIVCLKWRDETKYAQKDADIFCIEKLYPEVELEKQSTVGILKIPQVERYLSKFDDFWLVVYKPLPGLEKYCAEKKWNLIANKFELRNLLENKKAFREILIKSGATPITGEIFKAAQFVEDFYKKLKEKFGNNLVFQVAEMTNGGGLGTFFINNMEEYQKFLKRLPDLKEKTPEIEHINVTKFVNGVPASLISVATSKGTITGTLQAQIQDIALVNDPSKGSGLYCGHDWTYFRGNEEVVDKAKNIAKKFGDYINKNYNYKGLFGMDLLINIENNEVYPVECNPRYTDLFPVNSMNYLASGLIPLDIYHILEFVNPKYKINTESVSKEYKYASPASQLILSTKVNAWTKMNGKLEAGIYSFDKNGNIKFERGAYRFENLKNENEFLITEGVPSKDYIFYPESRICRLVFKRGILESKNKLNDVIVKVIENIYRTIDLIKIPEPEK